VAPVRLRLGQTSARHHPGELAAGQDVRGHDAWHYTLTKRRCEPVGVRDYNVRTGAASTGATSTSLRRSSVNSTSLRAVWSSASPGTCSSTPVNSTPSSTVCRRAGPGATLWDSTRSLDEARVYLRRIRWSWPGPMAHGPMGQAVPAPMALLVRSEGSASGRGRSRMGETETSSSGRRCCNVTAGMACHCDDRCRLDHNLRDAATTSRSLRRSARPTSSRASCTPSYLTWGKTAASIASEWDEMPGGAAGPEFRGFQGVRPRTAGQRGRPGNE
jgi:hypothetical protein